MKIHNTAFINTLSSIFIVMSFSLSADAQKSDFHSLVLPGPATLQTINFDEVDFKPLPY